MIDSRDPYDVLETHGANGVDFVHYFIGWISPTTVLITRLYTFPESRQDRVSF